MSKCVLIHAALAMLLSNSFAWAQNEDSSMKLRSPKVQIINEALKAQSGTQAGTLSTKAEKSKQRIENISVSENVFIPAPGQTGFSVRAQNVYRDFNFKNRSAGNRGSKFFETQKGLMIQTRFDHGAQNGWAYGGEVGTALGSLTESRPGMKDGEAKGLTDFVFTARKAQDTAKGQMVYGGHFNFSPGERVWATEKESGNLYSGGHVLSAFIGIQNDYSQYILGGRARHDILLDRNESFKESGNQRINFTRSNGNVFAVEGYFEKPVANRLFGASAGLGFVQPTDYRVSVGNAKMNMSSDAYQTLNLSAYARLGIREAANLEILPSWTYSKVLGASGGSFSVEDDTEVSTVSLTARWPM